MERLNSLVKEASETRHTGRGDQCLKAGLFEEWGLWIKYQSTYPLGAI
jgi:hypothetical protein